jgi:hypothetical protein
MGHVAEFGMPDGLVAAVVRQSIVYLLQDRFSPEPSRAWKLTSLG